ncbi:unnamed protein product [Sphagnum jensenii]|uniref:Uncharacterized protein n=1 Tax=Sphagnum jensenii TaxID=128206 RepID=A0ABP1A296_9BRYO
MKHAWADEVHSRIIRMECNLLYCLPAASVDGVTPSSKPKLDMDQISLLGGIGIICNEGLQGVGEAISKSIVTAMSQDVTNGHLNAQLLEDITRSLDMLGSEHTQPDVEFKLLIKVTMLSEGLMSGDVIGTSALARDRTLDPVLVSKAWATLCGHAM